MSDDNQENSDESAVPLDKLVGRSRWFAGMINCCYVLTRCDFSHENWLAHTVPLSEVFMIQGDKPSSFSLSEAITYHFTS